jgi:parvulin-like peptidyl-prolyl isomerase
MRVNDPSMLRRRPVLALLLTVPIAVALLALPAHAQGQPQVPFWQQGQLPAQKSPSSPGAPPEPKPAPAPPASPVILRVGGREVTQLVFDRLAQPYFARLKAELGDRFDADVRRLANQNVVDELVRRELLALEVGKQAVQPTAQEVDDFLKQDPLFQTNGTFDRAKFDAYKSSPNSNYLQVLPRVREMVAVNDLDQSLRRRFTPTPAQLRAEWEKRNEQVRLRVLPLLTRDMTLEPEASEADWASYYAAHPEQFMRRTRVRLRYMRLPLPAQTDSTRATAENAALVQGRALADSLRRGAVPDTGAADTGLFDIGNPMIPGLGRVAALTDTLARIDADTALRVVGPCVAPAGVVVGVIIERQPRHVPPMREVVQEVKRRADAEKRRTSSEAERRAFHAADPARWRCTRTQLTRVTLDPATVVVKPAAPAEVDRWYARHGRSLFGMPDSSRAWVPPATDSLRAVVRDRLAQEERGRRAVTLLEGIAAALGARRDVSSLVRAAGAVAETLSRTPYSLPDSIFPRPLTDSLVTSLVTRAGAVSGPRAFSRYAAVWRIDAVDTAFVPPYEGVRAQSDEAFAEARYARDEAEARAWLEQHRADYRTPAKYGLDYVAVRIPAADSVAVPEREIRAAYDANPAAYRQEEQVQARHILFMTRGAGPEVEKQAKARADSLRAAIQANGGDFAALARRFSQEPGADRTGGDLGWFGRGRMVKEFEAAAFALQPGETSPVVKTAFGYHIIRVEGRKAAGLRPYDEARSEIRTRMAQARGDSLARRDAESLRRRLAQGGDAVALAGPLGGLAHAPAALPTDPIAGFGIAAGLANDLPAMKPGAWGATTYRAGDAYLVLRVREVLPPHFAGYDEVRPRVLEDVRTARRREVLDRKVESLRAALAAGASLDSLAAPYGGLKDSGLLARTMTFVPGIGEEPRLVARAFAMKPGEVSDTVHTAQGVAWMRAEERRTPGEAAFAAAAAPLEAELVKQRYDAWVEEKKKGVRVEVLRADLKPRRP